MSRVGFKHNRGAFLYHLVNSPKKVEHSGDVFLNVFSLCKSHQTLFFLHLSLLPFSFLYFQFYVFLCFGGVMNPHAVLILCSIYNKHLYSSSYICTKNIDILLTYKYNLSELFIQRFYFSATISYNQPFLRIGGPFICISARQKSWWAIAQSKF